MLYALILSINYRNKKNEDIEIEKTLKIRVILYYMINNLNNNDLKLNKSIMFAKYITIHVYSKF